MAKELDPERQEYMYPDFGFQDELFFGGENYQGQNWKLVYDFI